MNARPGGTLAAGPRPGGAPTFYLGVSDVHWLRDLNIPAFVSRTRLYRRRTIPRPAGRVAIDSGAFSELQKYGGWRIDAAAYARELTRFCELMGPLDWAAPQDWMCEPLVIRGGRAGRQHFAGTGLSVAEHQARTVGNFLDLRSLDIPVHVIPVLQGYTIGEYVACAQRYAACGVDLAAEPVVGVGSVCRRQGTAQIGELFEVLASAGLRLHGFGVKTTGLAQYGEHLQSCDSLAWSKAGYHVRGCTPSHKSESCCRRFAVTWRERMLAKAAAPSPRQLSLGPQVGAEAQALKEVVAGGISVAPVGDVGWQTAGDYPTTTNRAQASAAAHR